MVENGSKLNSGDKSSLTNYFEKRFSLFFFLLLFVVVVVGMWNGKRKNHGEWKFPALLRNREEIERETVLYVYRRNHFRLRGLRNGLMVSRFSWHGESSGWSTQLSYTIHILRTQLCGAWDRTEKPLFSLSLSAFCVCIYIRKRRHDSLENLSFRPMKPKPLLPSFSSNRVCFPTKRKYLEKAPKKKFPFRSLSFFFHDGKLFFFLSFLKKKETLIPSYKFVCS